jgi:hypothetical protein
MITEYRVFITIIISSLGDWDVDPQWYWRSGLILENIFITNAQSVQNPDGVTQGAVGPVIMHTSQLGFIANRIVAIDLQHKNYPLLGLYQFCFSDKRINRYWWLASVIMTSKQYESLWARLASTQNLYDHAYRSWKLVSTSILYKVNKVCLFLQIQGTKFTVQAQHDIRMYYT